MSVAGYPFVDLGQALAYFNERNPAREARKNLLETESYSRPIIDDFTGRSPRDIWASLLAGMQRVLASAPVERAHVWVMRNYGPRSEHLAVEEIADRCHVSPRTIRRWCAGIDAEMEAEYRWRELLPIDDGAPHRYPRSPELRDGQPGDEDMPRYRARIYDLAA